MNSNPRAWLAVFCSYYAALSWVVGWTALLGRSEGLQWILFASGAAVSIGVGVGAVVLARGSAAAVSRRAGEWAIVDTLGVVLVRLLPATAGAVALAGVFAAFLVWRRRNPSPAREPEPALLPLLAGVLCLVSSVDRFFPLIAPRPGVLPPIHLDWRALLAAGVGAWLYRRYERRRPWSAKVGWIAGGLVAVLTLVAVGEFPLRIERQHAGFYLAPVNDLLHGKLPLVETASQYGVGVLYFLAGCFELTRIPPSYAALSLLLTVLLVAQYGLFYALLRRCLRNPLLPALALLTVLFANYWAGFGAVAYFPAAGPLRFGLPLLLLAALAWHRRPLAVALFALTSLWSIETFVYAVATVGGWVLFESADGKKREIFIRRLGAEAAVFLGAAAVAHLLFAFATWAVAGEVPHWGYYLPYLSAYSPLGGVGIETGWRWGEWVPVLFVYGTALCFGFTATPREGVDRRRAALACAWGCGGLAQFTYYLGQTHPSYLARCALPALGLCFVGLDAALAGRGSVRFRTASVFVACFAFFQLVFQVRHRVFAPTREKTQALHCLFDACPTGDKVARLADLVRELTPPASRVSLFLSTEDDATEVLLVTRRAHTWPLGETRQDLLVPVGFERILSRPPQLQAGDVLFVDDPIFAAAPQAASPDPAAQRPTAYDPARVVELQAALVAQACRSFQCVPIRRVGDVQAVRLDARRP